VQRKRAGAPAGDDVVCTGDAAEDTDVYDDTETRVASDVKAALARHRVLDSDLLGSLRALPSSEACRLAAELRACANACDSGPRVAIRRWSFLKAGFGVRS